MTDEFHINDYFDRGRAIQAIYAMTPPYVIVLNPEKTKTERQRNAMHLWLRELAQELNLAGLDQTIFFDKLREGARVEWTEHSTKEVIWRPIQEAMMGKASSEQLDTVEPDAIYRAIVAFLADRYGFVAPQWPDKFRAGDS